MMAKRKKSTIMPESKDNKIEETALPLVRTSDEPVTKKAKWVNKQRVLVFAARGITQRDRHLMVDLRDMMPHSKTESKFERKDPLFVINEICEMKNCSKCIFFEGRKKQDLFLWLADVPKGPSAKFYIENVHTMKELKMTGNCLKGTRPLLSFDSSFDTHPHWSLLKELMTQIFSTPKNHPKSQPFFDHVFTFTIIEKRIWFRNFQILEEDGQLAEIGPRFVLNPIKVFDGSFGGETIWENSSYVTPNAYRRMLNLQTGLKYRQKIEQKLSLAARQPTGDLCDLDPLDEEVFEDKNAAKIVKEVASNRGEGGKKKKKEKKKKMKNPKATGKKRAGAIFNEILGDSGDE
ncbi:ribosome biogenesis protein BRX1 homolog [Daphnia pulicaria]|uniref:ribosome biogenesis protein BRX1 homolog n=1 Tax=Daphnia pulicaria TaxID=35523 RepID=UPI001EEC5B98|nr:ribosome biogenesis protein BRX1 homolog [Daphnia pulicaria]